MKKVIQIIVNYRFYIISATILLVMAFSLLNLSAISNLKPDANYLRKQRQNLEAEQISIDASLKQQIEDLNKTPVNVKPGNLGTSDPFNP